jgi:hypothetical protein
MPELTGNTHPGLTLPRPKPPPEVPPGWRVGPPDFVGVGTQRSGTTWWWSVLVGHPEVAHDRTIHRAGGINAVGHTAGKELHFFDRFAAVRDIAPADYHRYFPRPAGSIVGEWTPRYMYDFWTAPMLHQVAPETKLLVMLRDPVQRFLSGLARWGPQPDPVLYPDQFHRGLYGQQLQHLLTYFDRSQVLVLQYERCLADPATEATRTFEFLGVEPDRWQPGDSATRRVGIVSPDKPSLGERTLAAIGDAYQSDLRCLLRQCPDLDTALWPTLRRTADRV